MAKYNDVEYTEKELKLREALETIVSSMSRDDMMYYCYTIIQGASDTRFRYYCTHVIFDDDNLNVGESDISWILKGESRICRSADEPDGYVRGIDYALLMFVVIMTHLHLKDIIKLYLLVNGGLLYDIRTGNTGVTNIELEDIRDRYKDKHRISAEAAELIESGATLKTIAEEVCSEVSDIWVNQGFNDEDMVDLSILM